MGTIFATRGVLRRSDTKIVFGRGSAPDPAGGAYNAPPDPLVGGGGGYLLPIPHPLDAFGVATPRIKSLVTALFAEDSWGRLSPCSSLHYIIECM